MNRLTTLRARTSAIYALGLYLPGALAARRLRDASRALRGVRKGHATHLPQAAWSELLGRRAIRLAAADKRNGNVNLAELAVLAQAAAAVRPGELIVEIGTFDGRTTLNLAINAPAESRVVTLDLPPADRALYALAPGERQYVDKPQPGARFRAAAAPWAAAAQRITQLLGDSATFDWSPYRGQAGLVFVDGSHACEYVRKDSQTAFALLAPGGMALWHDYGRWEGVTQALDEIEAQRRLGLRHVRGTSLVFWRADGRGDKPA
ncbi:MAG TPA: class I SAM-dependent methyltransferase [Xanthobacteraceae bacterium]|nr:class I SAM-dependent methyltransferase [Xanthobacteraceae bacterium]